LVKKINRPKLNLKKLKILILKPKKKTKKKIKTILLKGQQKKKKKLK